MFKVPSDSRHCPYEALVCRCEAWLTVSGDGGWLTGALVVVGSVLVR
jgi:hypothetical protein